MELCIIQTARQFEEHLAEAHWLGLQNPVQDSPQARRLELVLRLLRDYGHLRLLRSTADPVAAIALRMKERGLRNRDVAALLGGRNRASEILRRRRPLTLAMIRALHETLDIPLEALVRPCALARLTVRTPSAIEKPGSPR